MALGSGSSDSGENETTENNAEDTSAVTIEEQVLFEGNDIKITATGMEDGLFGTELKLLIENNSSKSVTVQARNTIVNGFMVDTMMSADVAAGKKANDSLTFQTSGLKDCGIESIATMEFTFHIMDAESWEDIVDTDTIVVNTSIASTYVQEVDDSGEVLVDANGIKIIQYIFGHSSEEITKVYIGTIDEKKDQFVNDLSDYLENSYIGKSFEIDNSPVISLRTQDLRKIVSDIYFKGKQFAIDNSGMNDIDIINNLITDIEKLRIQ